MRGMGSDATTLATFDQNDGTMSLKTPISRPPGADSSPQAQMGVLYNDKDIECPGKPPPKSRINPRVIADAILGLSDGLTVPFALTAGLSAFGNSKLVVLGGLAELIAGAISMGLGGFVGAKSEA